MKLVQWNSIDFCEVSTNASIVLYCFVLYIYIAVHTTVYLYSSAHQSEALPVQETQREESSLERMKIGNWSPVNKVDRVDSLEGRSWVQSEGPMIAKDRV